MRTSLPLISLLLAFGSATAGSAETVRLHQRPDPPGTPTEVHVGIAVVDVTLIDQARQSFEAQIIGRLRWRDQRLALPADAPDRATRRFAWDDIWDPRPALVNRRGVQTLEQDVLDVDAEGNVFYQQRLIGEFSSPLDLRDFPFDEQDLKLVIGSTEYETDEVTFVREAVYSGRLPSFSVAGWNVDLGEARTHALEVVGGRQRRPASFVLTLRAEREQGYYVLKVLVPMGLIVFMAWTVFWLDPSQLGAQLGVSTASVFSFVAFQVRLAELLPGVSYITRIDRFILGSTVLVFLAFGEAVLTGTLAASGHPERARRIDRWMRWVYPLLFMVLIYVTRWA